MENSKIILNSKVLIFLGLNFMMFSSLILQAQSDPPTTTTTVATSLTTNSVTLNGISNPNGTATTGYFRYSTANPGTGNDSFGTRVPSSSFLDVDLGSGSSEVPYSKSITNISPGTTYYYFAVSKNIFGTTFGSVLSFTTPADKPVVTTGSITSLTPSSAIANCSSNPKGASTTAWIRYSTTHPGTASDFSGIRVPAAGGAYIGSGTSTVAYSQSITGLTPETTYYYWAVAQNDQGISFGSIQSFTTPNLPVVTTISATSVTNNSAVLNGNANPKGLAVTGYFRYSTGDPVIADDLFGTRVPVAGGTSLGSGTIEVSYSRTISGLSPNTTYYYCAIAINSAGTSFGSVLSFTTEATAPISETVSATEITRVSAVLNNSVNPGGLVTTAWVRYSTTNPGTAGDLSGIRIPAAGGFDAGSGSITVPYSLNISGLTKGTTYYYWAVAQNDQGIAFGSIRSFTTPDAPVITWDNPEDITEGTALSAIQLNATANVDGEFVYTPPSGTILPIGENQMLTTTFTPTDLVNYFPVSYSVYINVLLVTNLEEAGSLNNIDVLLFPNPANDVLFVKSANKIESIEILDLTGRIIYKSIVNQEATTINTLNLKTGMYFVKLKSNNACITKRIIIEK